MKRKHIAIVVVVGLLGLVMETARAANPAEATITVTPQSSIDLTFTGGATYDFGGVDVGVGITTVSVSALTLHNNGTGGVGVTKYLQSASGGWSNSGTPGPDTFSLYVATATAQPLKADFAAVDHLLPNGSGAADSLWNINQSSSTLVPGADYKLWFRLDMPTSITQQGQKTILVEFTGSAA